MERGIYRRASDWRYLLMRGRARRRHARIPAVIIEFPRNCRELDSGGDVGRQHVHVGVVVLMVFVMTRSIHSSADQILDVKLNGNFFYK